LGKFPLAAVGPLLTTIGPTTRILDAVPNISPRLRKQLVLELEVRKGGAKVVKRLPRSILHRKALPLDQHLPFATALHSTQSTSRDWEQPTIHGGRKGTQSGRRLPRGAA